MGEVDGVLTNPAVPRLDSSYKLLFILLVRGSTPITSEGVAAISRCGFRSVRYFEVKIRYKSTLGPRIVSGSEVVGVANVRDFQSVTAP